MTNEEIAGKIMGDVRRSYERGDPATINARMEITAALDAKDAELGKLRADMERLVNSLNKTEAALAAAQKQIAELEEARRDWIGSHYAGMSWSVGDEPQFSIKGDGRSIRAVDAMHAALAEAQKRIAELTKTEDETADDLTAAYLAGRAEGLEEAAKVADSYSSVNLYAAGNRIAGIVRALAAK